MSDGAGFWHRVAIRGVDDCWLWRGARGHNGYGRVWWQGKTRRAHRVAWLLWFGAPPDGLLVCHRCDVRDCCNPRHLFVGSQRENLADMYAKERGPTGERSGMRKHPEVVRGERNPRAKITEQEVRAIREVHAREGVSKAELGRRYGLTAQAVGFLIRRRTWAHVAVLFFTLLTSLVQAQPSAPGGVVLQDEGVTLGRARAINCSGAGITCTLSGTTGTLNVTGGGSGSVSSCGVELADQVGFWTAPGVLCGDNELQWSVGNFALTGGRFWDKRGGQVYNVRAWGAVCDGVTDDTAAIQAALDAAGVLPGGVVFIPGGNCVIASGLTIPNRVHLVGAGRVGTILTYTGAGIAIQSSTPGTTEQDWLLSDFFLTTTTGTIGIDLDTVKTSSFERLGITGFSTAGVSMHSVTSGGTVYNRFYDVTVTTPTGAGTAAAFQILALSTNANVFTSCRALVLNAGYGWYIEDSNDNTVINSQSEGPSSGGSGWGFYVNATVLGRSDQNRLINVRAEHDATGIEIASEKVRDTMIFAPWFGSNGTDLVDPGAANVPPTNNSRTQVDAMRSNFFQRFSQQQDRPFRFTRLTNGGSQVPMVKFWDPVTTSGTPVTVEIDTDRSAGYFLRGLQGGNSFFEFDALGRAWISNKLRIGATANGNPPPPVGPIGAISDPSFPTGAAGNSALLAATATNNDEMGLAIYVNDGADNRRSRTFLDDNLGETGFQTTASTNLPKVVVDRGTRRAQNISGSPVVSTWHVPHTVVSDFTETATQQGYQLDGYRDASALGPLWITRRGRGTEPNSECFGVNTPPACCATATCATTAVSADDVLVTNEALGFGTAFKASTDPDAAWNVFAAETFTGSAHGTYQTWENTLKTTTKRCEKLRLRDDGFLMLREPQVGATCGTEYTAFGTQAQAGGVNMEYAWPAAFPAVGTALVVSAVAAPAVTLTWTNPTPALHNLLDSTVHGDTLTHTPVLGDLIAGNGTPKWGAIAGQITTSKKFLTQTGSGAVSALPIWDTIAVGDVPAHNLLSATHGDTTAAAVVRGDLVTGQTVTPKWTRLAFTAIATRYLANTGSSATEPAWDQVDWTNGVKGGATNALPYFTSATVGTTLAPGTGVLHDAGAAPSWSLVALGTDVSGTLPCANATDLACLLGRAGGQHLKGGTATGDHLELSPNNQTFANLNAGEVQVHGPMNFPNTFTATATETGAGSGVFATDHPYWIRASGTITASGSTNDFGWAIVSGQDVIKYSTTQILASAPTFDSKRFIQPTAAVTDGGGTLLALWPSFYARNVFLPSLATAITAQTQHFQGVASEPHVGIAVGSHASALAVVTDDGGFVTNPTAATVAIKNLALGTADDAGAHIGPQGRANNYRHYWARAPFLFSNADCTANLVPYGCCSGAGAGTCTAGTIKDAHVGFDVDDLADANAYCTANHTPYQCCSGVDAGTCQAITPTGGAPSISLRSLGPLVPMEHAGKAAFGTASAPNTTVDSNGDLATRAGTDITLVNIAIGPNNDIAIGSRSFVRFVGPTTAFSVTGFASGFNGKFLRVRNTTAQAMTIVNAATSAAANQILTNTAANVVLAASISMCDFIYDATATKWILIVCHDNAGAK